MRSMLTLYLVRHGQTEASRNDILCGTLDLPLNPSGLAIADALANRYAGETWQAVYASPKLRAIQTATPLAERLGLPLRIEPGLREIEYGEWEGRTESELRAEQPEAYARWEAAPDQLSPPGGETAQQVAARALPVVDALRARHPTGQVLAVSHKATIRIIVCALLGIDLRLFRARIAQPVGSSTIFQFKQTGPLLRRLGDLSYLP